MACVYVNNIEGSNEETLNKRMSSISSRYNLKALYILSISRELVASANAQNVIYDSLYKGRRSWDPGRVGPMVANTNRLCSFCSSEAE